MYNIDGLTNQRTALLDEVDAIVAGAGEDGLTEEQRSACDEKMDRVQELDKDIERLNRLAQQRVSVPDNLPEIPAIRSKPATPAGQSPELRVTAVSRPRYGSLRAFTKPGGEELAYRFGRFLHATIHQDDDSRTWCREAGIESRALATNVNTAAGFLVPDEFSNTLIDIQETFGVFRREARVLPMASDVLRIPRRTAGYTATWTGEGGTITASDMSVDQVTLTAKKPAIMQLVNTELSEDAFVSIADTVAREMAIGLATAEDEAGFNGDGTSTYGGIYGVRPKIIDGTHTASAIDAASGNDTFAEITNTDLANTMAALHQSAQRTAKWYCSAQAYYGIFTRLAAAGGGNTINTLPGGLPFQYLGAPIVISQSMPKSTGDLSNVAMVLFGDLSMACTMGVRRGITIATDMSRYFELDQTAIKATERVDIVAHDLGDNTDGGPLVALVGE